MSIEPTPENSATLEELLEEVRRIQAVQVKILQRLALCDGHARNAWALASELFLRLPEVGEARRIEFLAKMQKARAEYVDTMQEANFKMLLELGVQVGPPPSDPWWDAPQAPRNEGGTP